VSLPDEFAMQTTREASLCGMRSDIMRPLPYIIIVAHVVCLICIGWTRPSLDPSTVDA
jgi:hypothetical protein